MITLINTSKNYQVSGETQNFKLSGNATVIAETTTITNFNGSFTNTEGAYSGNFNYSENENGKANKNIYDADKTNLPAMDTLLDDIIEELKQEINDNQ